MTKSRRREAGQHGTPSRYKFGCGCQKCCVANVALGQKFSAKRERKGLVR